MASACTTILIRDGNLIIRDGNLVLCEDAVVKVVVSLGAGGGPFIPFRDPFGEREKRKRNERKRDIDIAAAMLLVLRE